MELPAATEALAEQLYALYYEALGYTNSSWDTRPDVKEAWIQVAQFVNAMLSNYIAIYGYNGKEPYVGLEAFIQTPDHK